MALNIAAVGPQPSGMPVFSGSYRVEDCRFLLKPLHPDPTPIAEKERQIQSGLRHYSEMLSPESPPSACYLALFRDLTETYATRIGRDILSLATHIAASREGPLTVVSLARAGTPIGALLTRALRARHDGDTRHYSISIIRDRGIDANAFRHILRVDQRPPAGLVFVDGWTAKGVITRELKSAVQQWNATSSEQLDPRLYVLSDIGGSADVAASFEDYAIPSGILNATVSGLVSRSILNAQIGPADFHGCVFYEDYAHLDQSNWFLDRVSATFDGVRAQAIATAGRGQRRVQTERWLESCLRSHGLTDINLVKPGVAEATRVLLRRVPECLIVQDPRAADLRHLLALARERAVGVETDPDLPFQAAALIRSLRRATPSTRTLRSNEP
jgi:hypothetical protein